MKEQLVKEIREAYLFLRKHNSTVPSETLQFMLDASIEKAASLTHTEGEEKYSKGDMIRFAYWLRNGLTNLEYAKKRTESHLEYWLEGKK